MSIHSPGGVINAHKAIVADSLHYSHIRKRCACNAVVTARQLTQYGRCATCEKVARLNALHAAREAV